MRGGVVLSALALLAVILSMMVSPSTGGGATSDAAFANAGFVAGRDGDAVAGVRLLFLQTDSTWPWVSQPLQWRVFLSVVHACALCPFLPQKKHFISPFGFSWDPDTAYALDFVWLGPDSPYAISLASLCTPSALSLSVCLLYTSPSPRDS